MIERLGRAARIENAHALPSRVEEWAAAEGAGGYDAVTARALASLPVLVEYASPLLREGGVLVAWKGTRDAEEERAGARAGEQVGMSSQGVHSVTPFAGAKHHHLHVYEKVRATPPGYPRRPGMAQKRPLG